MILVDKEIRRRINNDELIITGYNDQNLNGVSYDLTIESIYDTESKGHDSYELAPGETVFVKTQEKLRIPNDILGRIAEKNSRMRQGLRVEGPHYQPGHETYAYLRIQNISVNYIDLNRGMKIAQIIFEELSDAPEKPYSEQESKSFQNEESYRGLGNYEEEYNKQMHKKLDKEKESIEDISHRIYANVLTLMGVMVAIFAMLTINYQAFVNANLTTSYIVVMNLTMALCIVVMMGIILIFVNKAKNKKFLIAYIAALVVLAIAVIVMAICL